MKKYNYPTDDFLRETLKDHHVAPSDAAKKAFLRDALQLPMPARKGRKGLILFSAFLALVGAGIILWAITSDKSDSKHEQEANVTSIHAVNANPSSEPKTNPQLSSFKQSYQQLSSSKQTPPPASYGQPGSIKLSDRQISPAPHKSNQIIVTEQPHKQKDTSKTIFASAVYGKSTEPGTSGTSLSTPVNSVSATGISSGEGNMTAVDTLNGAGTTDLSLGKRPDLVQDSSPSIKKQDSVKNPVSGMIEKNRLTAKKESKWIPSIGLYYTPEWMFNTLEGTKFVNNFGIEGTFHFGRFSVRTGAGISVARGTNELEVEYNDFLGAYNKLDSMNFTWNDPTHTYIPTMYMSKQDVWDSLMKLDYARVVKRYTYLQIPMVMGYDFWQSDRVSLGVRLGPVMSILFASKQLSEEYDPGNKRIVSVNNIAPEQVSLNWQVMGGFNAAFRLTDALNIEVEPCVRYYFNSVYEKPANNTKPWSAGVRAAFIVRF